MIKPCLKGWLAALALLALLAIPLAKVSAEDTALRFVVHPVFPAEQARQVFVPVADYLARTCAQPLTVETARDFHAYRRDWLGQAFSGLVVEEAHLAARRQQDQGFIPLVRDRRFVAYQLVVNEASRWTSKEQLTGQFVASLAGPSLGHALLDRWFPDPIHQPLITTTPQSWHNAVELVFSGEAAAAIVPATVAEKYPNLRRLHQSDPVASTVLMASPDLPEGLLTCAQMALTGLREGHPDFGLLYELDVERFVAASRDDLLIEPPALSKAVSEVGQAAQSGSAGVDAAGSGGAVPGVQP
ncbi:MAG: phosphate/phosphite/phosphonate ABC transporter substrate-binding protein [Wenzhouxiangella sp.]